jgi:small ligand-binding sensory domain FIST
VAAAQRSLAEVEHPAALLVFCSGKLAPELGRLAAAIAPLVQVPVVLASGPGVLTERRELEGETAATGIVWSGKPATLGVSPVTSAPTAGELRALLGTDHNPPKPTLLLLRSEGFDPEQLWRVRTQAPNPLLFGAGTHGSPGLIAIKDGKIHETSALALRIPGLCPPGIHTAHSCRLLAAPAPITQVRGSMVDEIGGEPALALLERLGASLGEPKDRARGQQRPLVFTVLAAPGRDADSPELLVRGIQGVDPGRKSLLISAEAEPGMLITFAVRDAHAARTEMSRICRQAARNLAGAAPRFGLYFNCTGRGKSLHAGPNVDTRVLREHFPGTPMAGFQSAFEIGPFDGAPALQLYTGMLAVFAAPS